MRNFRELKIWQQGIQIVKDTYQLTAMLPKEEKYGIVSQMNRAAVSIPSNIAEGCSRNKEEKYGIVSQMNRAAVSIPSNIAEGCSRNSEIDFKRFLEIAQGSAFELETQLLILEEIGLLKSNGNDVTTLLTIIHEEQRMLNSLITKIKSEQN